MKQTVGIIGLGLIGGSFAKALQAFTDTRVLAFDLNPEVTVQALADGSIGGVLGHEDLPTCDFIIIALRPHDALDWLQRYAEMLDPATIIFDVAGVKRFVADEMVPLAAAHGLRFISVHPMAGFHEGGYANATDEMFQGASFIICSEDSDKATLEALSTFARSVGFGRIVVTTPSTHDEMIAYTSQLAHLVSSAYIKDPGALLHAGYSAGSFQDMTRVAILDPAMWSELCLENADMLIAHLDVLNENLAAFRTALANRDAETLTALFAEGVTAKRASIATHQSDT